MVKILKLTVLIRLFNALINPLAPLNLTRETGIIPQITHTGYPLHARSILLLRARVFNTRDSLAFSTVQKNHYLACASKGYPVYSFCLGAVI